MPWHVAESSSCPDSKPYAVIKDSDGTVEGCHASETAAKQQMAALYAQESLNPTGKSMKHKSFDIIETKADAEAGTFEATVAVFGNIDRGGDRIMPGAFDKTLAKWRESGDPIPVILSHSWDNPFHHVGIADPNDIVATTKGLHVRGQLDVNDNEVARQVHRLMARRSLKEFSFGYSVSKGGEKRAKDGANELNEIDLFEIGPTLKGMNPATELHAVKSALGVEEVPDAETLRKQSEQIQRELIERDLPEVTGEVVEPEPEDSTEVKELKEVVATLEKRLEEALAEPERTPEELRQESERIQRELIKRGLPEVEAPEGEPAEVVAMRQVISDLQQEVEELKARPVKTQEELRRESERVQRDLIAKDLPDPKEPEPEPDRITELTAKVDALVQGFEKAQAEIEERKKAEEAAKEQLATARAVDPLRRASDEAMLGASLHGVSLPKPPTTQDEPTEEQIDLKALRQRSRDVMLELLTGANHGPDKG